MAGIQSCRVFDDQGRAAASNLVEYVGLCGDIGIQSPSRM